MAGEGPREARPARTARFGAAVRGVALVADQLRGHVSSALRAGRNQRRKRRRSAVGDAATTPGTEQERPPG